MFQLMLQNTNFDRVVVNCILECVLGKALLTTQRERENFQNLLGPLRFKIVIYPFNDRPDSMQKFLDKVTESLTRIEKRL